MIARTTIFASIAMATAVFSPVAEAASDDYLAWVRSYADAMVAHGTDTYGEKHTPLFAVTMDRATMDPPAPPEGGFEDGGNKTINYTNYDEYADRFPDVPGLRDRYLWGANPQTDRALYHILYDLTEITGEDRYAAAADAALKHFFENCLSPDTGLGAWGEHISVNLYTEKPMSSYTTNRRGRLYHEINGEWTLFDPVYRLAPEQAWRFAYGLCKHQGSGGNFSRHARYYGGGGGYAQYPRYAGQMIAAMTDAYSRPENAHRQAEREEMLTRIKALIDYQLENRERTEAKMLPYARDKGRGNRNKVAKVTDTGWATSNIEFARCLLISAPDLPDDLAAYCRRTARLIVSDYLRLDQNIEKSAALADHYDTRTGKAELPKQSGEELWKTGYGTSSSASAANDLYQTAVALRPIDARLADQLCDMVKQVAGFYLRLSPDLDDEQLVVKPNAYAGAIDLMLNCHELTGETKYLERARFYADQGVELFLGGVSGPGAALPRVSNRHPQYETNTGGPGFMAALLRLHQTSD